MKRRLSSILAFAFLLPVLSPVFAAIETIPLTGTWEFLPGHCDAVPSTLPPRDDSAWGGCPVPALWWEAEELGDSWLRGTPPGFLGCCGWYRRTVIVPEPAR